MQGNWVISGSDDGTVRLFDQRSAKLVKCLRHGDVGELVQAVTAHSDGGKCLIVSGASSPGPSDIKVWLHTTTSDLEPAIQPGISYGWKTWQICMLVLIVSFIVNVATSQIMKPVYGWILQVLVRLAESNSVSLQDIVRINDTTS